MGRCTRRGRSMRSRQIAAARLPCFQGALARASVSKICPTIGMAAETGVIPIVVLLFLRFPSAIVKSVGAIIIDAANTGSFGPFTHVLKKVQEAHPPITDDYAPPAVSSIVRRVSIQTALLHRHPASVSRRDKHLPARTACVAMYQGGRFGPSLLGLRQLGSMFWRSNEYPSRHTPIIAPEVNVI